MSFSLLLISVDISSNYVESGDILYVTTKWQNIGDSRAGSSAKIAVDLFFDMSQRHLENQTDGFRFTWTPYPELFQIAPGEVFSCTGSFIVPVTWCGTFFLNLSVIAENGEAICFVGKNSLPVASEYITDIDFGWGWGRKMLEASRKPLSIEINKEMSFEMAESSESTFAFKRFILSSNFPSIEGMDSIRWKSLPPIISYRNLEDNKLHRCITSDDLRFYPPVVREDRAVYKVSGIFGKFDILFCYNNCLSVYIDNVVENPGYELISVYFPKMFQAGEDATLVNFFCGGREVKIADSLPKHVVFPFDVVSTVAVYNSRWSVAFLTDDTEIKLHQSIGQNNNGKYGVLGAELVYRVLSNAQGQESIFADPLPLQIQVFDESGWQCVAKHLQGKLLNNNKGIYNHTLFYKICVDTTMQHNEKNPQTLSKTLRFSDVIKVIDEIYNVTNGLKQVVYLVGWQAEGHDTEYPYPHRNRISSRVGTDEEWEQARQYAKSRNAILSLHDNFDDSYITSNPSMENVAIDRNGAFYKGWLWAGGMTYILSPKAYNLSGEMVERVKTTLSRFNIEESYHLDVLTSEIRRYDFSDKYRSASRENIEFKKEIIKSFNNYGVDVTSESLSMPFVGHIGYALHTRYSFNETLFFGERVIPITTMIFHGFIPYNMGSGSLNDLLYAVAYGANAGMDIEKDHLVGINQKRSIFLHSMPMFMLENYLVTQCKTNDEELLVEYENNSFVEVNFKKNTYKIVVGGKIIGWNYNSVIPGKDEYYVYSVSGGMFEINLPSDWSSIEIYNLSTSEKTCKGTFDVCGRFELDVLPDVPVLIRRNN